MAISFSHSYKTVQSLILRAAILCAVWSFLGFLGYSRHYLLEVGPSSSGRFWTGLPVWLLCYLAWVPLTPLIFRLERRFPLEFPLAASKLAALIGAGLLFSYSAYVLSAVISLLSGAFGSGTLWMPNWVMPSRELGFEGTIFCATVAAAAALRKFRELEARRRQAAQFAIERANIEAELRKAELETLRMRLNPHFLFNAFQPGRVIHQPQGTHLPMLGYECRESPPRISRTTAWYCLPVEIRWPFSNRIS